MVPHDSKSDLLYISCIWKKKRLKFILLFFWCDIVKHWKLLLNEQRSVVIALRLRWFLVCYFVEIPNLRSCRKVLDNSKQACSFVQRSHRDSYHHKFGHLHIFFLFSVKIPLEKKYIDFYSFNKYPFLFYWEIFSGYRVLLTRVFKAHPKIEPQLYSVTQPLSAALFCLSVYLLVCFFL